MTLTSFEIHHKTLQDHFKLTGSLEQELGELNYDEAVDYFTDFEEDDTALNDVEEEENRNINQDYNDSDAKEPNLEDSLGFDLDDMGTLANIDLNVHYLS